MIKIIDLIDPTHLDKYLLDGNTCDILERVQKLKI